MRASYSQFLPCGHLAIADTLIIWTAAKSPAKVNYRPLPEIDFCYYGFLLLQTFAIKDTNFVVPRVSAIKGVDCIMFKYAAAFFLLRI